MYRSDMSVRYRFAGGAAFAIMQQDGNFVQYNTAMVPLFHTGTWNNPGAKLRIQDDGNLVVYAASNAPLWNIGVDQDNMDPRLAGDVVGRDLDVPVYGAFGHLALNVTGGQLIGVYSCLSNAVRIETLSDFKRAGEEYWGTASPNIPPGRSAPACYQVYCLITSQFQTFDMRMAITRAAYGASLIGATYTLGTQWKGPTWGHASHTPTRGLFRCDTFVLWALWQPSYYSPTAEGIAFKSFVERQLNNPLGIPMYVFSNLQAYQ